MSTLTSESSSVDRSGAAQGLAEVVGGLGVEKMNALMPDIIRTSERGDIAPHVKDGYIMMFIYMPTVFPDEFTEYIGQVWVDSSTCVVAEGSRGSDVPTTTVVSVFLLEKIKLIFSVSVGRTWLRANSSRLVGWELFAPVSPHAASRRPPVCGSPLPPPPKPPSPLATSIKPWASFFWGCFPPAPWY